MWASKMTPKPEDAVERSTRLARVRENQRKSRARKQQYIEELEQKVASCNAQAQQQKIDHLIAFQKLEAENAKLRSLLYTVGIGPDFLEGLLKDDESHPAATEKIAIPRLKAAIPRQSPSSQYAATTKSAQSCSPSPSNPINSGCNTSSSCTVAVKSESTLSATTTAKSSPLPQPYVVEPVTTAEPIPTQQQSLPSMNQNVVLPPISSLCDCGPESARKWPSLEDSANTTPCELAQDMIDQYNSKGIDLNIIKQRLWSGFRNGDDSGCRVRNSLLFEVLDEISGDVSMTAGT